VNLLMSSGVLVATSRAASDQCQPAANRAADVRLHLAAVLAGEASRRHVCVELRRRRLDGRECLAGGRRLGELLTMRLAELTHSQEHLVPKRFVFGHDVLLARIVARRMGRDPEMNLMNPEISGWAFSRTMR
jgi:hypothetical protein